MNFTVTKGENHNLIVLTDTAIAAPNTDTLKTECVKLMKDNPFTIFNCKALTGIDNAQKNLFTSIEALAKKAGGSIILSELHDDMIEKMEAAGINCVPTDDEAIDFIFMEQIESQFADDDEDEEEDD